jgi:hypothetical protein
MPIPIRNGTLTNLRSFNPFPVLSHKPVSGFRLLVDAFINDPLTVAEGQVVYQVSE